MAQEKRTTRKALKGPLEFIHHDVKSVQALARRPIKHHVHSKLNDPTKPHIPRRTVKLPGGHTAIRSDHGEEVFHLESCAAFAQGRPSGRDQVKREDSYAILCTCGSAARSLTSQDDLMAQSYPLTLLRKGNSDPFGTLAINVTPQVNAVMTFVRDYYIAGIYGGARAWVTNGHAVRGWRLNVACLNDQCSALALLAFVTAMMGNMSVGGRLNAVSTHLKAKGYSVFRTRLDQKQELDNERMLWTILMLFSAELLANNLEAVKLHAQMLGQIYGKRPVKTPRPGDLSILLRLCVWDTSVAFSRMSRTVVTTEEWVVQIAHPPYLALRRLIDPEIIAWSTSNLDKSVLDHPFLQECFVETRQHATWLTRQASTPLVSEERAFFTHLICNQSQVTLAKLLHFYLDLMSDIASLRTAPTEGYLQACLALGACFVVLHFANNPIVAGKPLWSAVSSTLSQIRLVIGLSLRAATKANCTKSNTTHLWILYLGATAEQRDTRKYPDPTKGWFNATLAQHARGMGLLSWQQVQPVLEKFVFSAIVRPHGSEWFWKTMGASLDSAESGEEPAIASPSALFEELS